MCDPFYTLLVQFANIFVEDFYINIQIQWSVILFFFFFFKCLSGFRYQVKVPHGINLGGSNPLQFFETV